MNTLIKKSIACLGVACMLVLFISSTSVNSALNFDTERLLVKISCFDCVDGNGTLIVHNPFANDMQVYNNNLYNISWYSGKGELLAVNTTTLPAACARNYVVYVTENTTSRSGTDNFSTENCRLDRESNYVVQEEDY